MALEPGLTVLVVDDDEGHVELVRRNLRRAGIVNPIAVARDGSDALDFVFGRGGRRQERDHCGELLLLLDINMPGLDGVEVLRQLKQDPATRTIPIVMLTTTDDPREVQRCYSLGCNVYVTKPVDPPAFIEAVARLGFFLSIVAVPAWPPPAGGQ